MRIHAAAKLFPELPEIELQELARDIEANGLLYPIELLDGKIIDGRNRFKALKSLGKHEDPCNFVEADLNGQTPIEYVWSLNGVRRHLTPAQKAAIAVELLPTFEAEAKKRQGARNDLKPDIPQNIGGCNGKKHKNEATEKAADITGANRQYVSDAKKIKEESPDVFEELKAGKITIPQAKRKIKETKKESEPTEKPKTGKPFDADKAGDRLRDWLRNELDKWPKEHLHEAIHWIKEVIKYRE